MRDLKSILPTLTGDHEVGPCRLRFDPAIRGTGGFRADRMLEHYAQALLLAWKTFSTEPHGRRLSHDTVPVYLVDRELIGGDPFMSLNAAREPFIVLPTRIPECTFEAEVAIAMLYAIHEFSHVLCNQELSRRERALRDIMSEKWRWFNEATAVWSEHYLLPSHTCHVPFLLDWCEHPEFPMTLEPQWYVAGLLARYLEFVGGPGFVARVWRAAEPADAPMIAIRRLLPDTLKETFFHDFCVESFFREGFEASPIFAPVHARYDGRAVSEDPEQLTGSLGPLCCRFLRLPRPSGREDFRVRFSGRGRLRLSLAAVSSSGAPMKVHPVTPDGVTTFKRGAADHFIAVVSNSEEELGNPEYRIEIHETGGREQ